MSTTIVIIAVYLAICCMLTSLYIDAAKITFKPFGPVWYFIALVIIFLSAPVVMLWGIIKGAIKKKKVKTPKKTKDINEPIASIVSKIVMEKFKLKEGEFFRFTNQKSDDIYYFKRYFLKKVEKGHVKLSKVSYNWLLDPECQIEKLESIDVHRYLAKYPEALGGK